MSFLKKVLKKCQSISFRNHILLGIIIRLGLIIYGEIQDEIAQVPYTDIDYKVVTDGARHILQGSSPFKRHTYRYSPLLAILLIPNILVHKCFGKILFSLFDILTGIMIERVVYNELKIEFIEHVEKDKCKDNKNDNDDNDVEELDVDTDEKLFKKKIETSEEIKKLHLPVVYSKWAENAALFWFYNPLSMAIATRGNGDSISSFFVLATAYFIHKFDGKDIHKFWAGLCLGVSIHLRIYPIIFCLPIFLSLSAFRPFSLIKPFILRFYLRMVCVVKAIFFINLKQKYLILGTFLGFGTLTVLFYLLYGMEYLFEAYFYHLTRTDIRHNFSLYFLMQYLIMDLKFEYWGPALKVLPRLLILLYLSTTFGWNRRTLSFCMFCQTFIMVTYNSVITSQYFVWYLSLLPLCFKNFHPMPTDPPPLPMFVMWSSPQLIWLTCAYFLEFLGFNTFNQIGLGCALLFIVHILLFVSLINMYEPNDVKIL